MEKIDVRLDQIQPDSPRYADRPDFTPDLSPLLMAQLGVFDRGYFHEARPMDLEGVDPRIIELLSQKPDPKANLFGCRSGLSMAKWKSSGWINEADPLGWYHFYCRFHAGRRSDDDDRQIKRWIDYRRRWTPKDSAARKRQAITDRGMQALVHWALDPTPIARPDVTKKAA